MVDGSADDGVDSRLGADVCDDSYDLVSMCSDRLGQTIGVSISGQDARACLHKSANDGASDTPRCTGNDHNFVLQVVRDLSHTISVFVGEDPMHREGCRREDSR